MGRTGQVAPKPVDTVEAPTLVQLTVQSRQSRGSWRLARHWPATPTVVEMSPADASILRADMNLIVQDGDETVRDELLDAAENALETALGRVKELEAQVEALSQNADAALRTKMTTLEGELARLKSASQGE
jgi:hypothetical protein